MKRFCWECWVYEVDDYRSLLIPAEVARDLATAGCWVDPHHCDRCAQLGFFVVEGKKPLVVSDEDKAARVELMEKISS